MNPGWHARHRRGQALVEFALVLPLLFLLIVNVVNFGGLIYAWIVVASAARTGVQYFIMGGASAGAFIQPSAAMVRSIVAGDLAPLPRRATAQVRVCLRTTSGVTCDGPGSRMPPTDVAESGITYVIGSVEVTYYYRPLLPLPGLPGTGLYPTLPAMTISRQAAMRVLQ
ncbi:MAG TPA: TadE/TadG family type IV pilus assembly protein [Bryobacteraceae bacterium]|nr:TadE/TadG family type IV pilus assembly protein [Bryobacteraceae bacterium]